MKTTLLAMIACLASACTAPGEPPAHPSQGDYQDLLRRETDKTQSSLATMHQSLSLILGGKMTRNYAAVVSHHSAADLTSVATDLAQIEAPTARQAQAQDELRALSQRQATLIDSVDSHWGDATALQQLANQIDSAANHAQQLSKQLD